ncbi:FAD-dependent monooxygenase [Streptomyces botrytidirepellens]|uniref:Pentachlorophenol monooxygenase n=1 Tax=Streptomyces botrytidirepellens TaxID=2486417 RepID=A0A3M8WA41_9ACTN|nr:FAD-dependent monooxygenase [Streptomyces botrytidirepellens]RNG26992.1 pentachlorophenol monooxygenase [Streptomyces botrytidirepellens]
MAFNDVKEAEVLIIGAGPAGLTLAIDLARRGVAARIVERGERLFPGSRGKGLQPRTQEVFDDLGVMAAVRAAGGPYPPMMGWEDGRRLGAFEMIVRTGPTPGTPYHDIWMLPQWRTAEILYARLREMGGEVEFGAACTGLTQDADGVIAHLSYADGSTGTVRAAYAVAADGGRSTVRKALGIAMAGETVDPHPLLVADVTLTGPTGLDRDHWHVWQHAKGGALALCPLAGTGLFQAVAQYEDKDAVPDPDPEAVRRLIVDRTHLAESEVGEVRWASPFRARAAMAEQFREGRVFLVGDAAHIHSPAGGQGLNTSVQDAYNLGWKLGAVLRGGADPVLLDSYEEERMPVAAGVLGISTRIHRAEAEGAAGDADAKEPRRTAEVHQLGLTYRGTALAVDRRTPHDATALRAGDRAPDAPCTLPDGTPFHLFDAFRGPHVTVLALGGAEPPAPDRASVRTYRVGGPAPDLLDPDGHLRAGYADQGVFVIRPDGYVGCAADRADEVTGYLTTLGA